MPGEAAGVRAFLALLGTVLFVVTGCTSVPGRTSEDLTMATRPANSRRTITWAFEQEFSGYNLNTPAGGTQANIVVLNGVLGGFWKFGPDGALVLNPDFGTYQKIDDNPLTVRYKINPKAVWSDGVPVSCEDIVLAWLAGSGITGRKGFAAGSTLGLGDMDKPVCRPGDKTVTVTYRRPFADWAAQFGVPTILPAHIVARQGGLTRSFVDYADDPTSPDLAKAIAFYNVGWSLRPGELKKDLMPSSGPYVIDSWSAGQSITLRANPKWWGRPPSTDTVVIRFVAGTAQPQALRNGEIQAMDPQPQVDLVQQLRAMGDMINLATGEAFRYEHLDFSLRSVFKDRTVREAFSRCVPRQQIVDDLVRPQDPRAQILQSRFVYPFQAVYPDFRGRVGGNAYDRVDLPGARRLLAGRTPTVRIGWSKDPRTPNRRRADTVTLIQQSCRQVGFRVLDAGSPTFLDKEWVGGNYDVALFSWSGSPLVAGTSDFFRSGGGNNTTGYASRLVDQLFDQLVVEADPARQVELLRKIDMRLWADLVTIPLFTFPAVLATAKDVRGMQYNATLTGLTWNVSEWARG